MSKVQENIAVITTFLDEVWNKGNESAIDDLYAPDGRAKGIGEEFQSGPEQFKAFHRLMHQTCGNIRVTPKLVLADDDSAIYHSIFTMTHKASDKEIRMEAGGTARIRDGKIVEAHNIVSFLDMLIALGAVPADVLPTALLETK